MADYNKIYTLPFVDYFGLTWRVDLLQKDGPITADPFILEGSETPLILDRKNNDEDKFSGIVKTRATISYVIRNDSDPAPETFINIEDDEYLIEVYRDGALYWKGFMNSENNTYDWQPRPFVFSITGTDMTFQDSIPVYLNDDDGILLYDYITIGDFLNRSLLFSASYDNPSVKVLYNKKPTEIGVGQITDSLYMHTDAVYSFSDGPQFVTDALLNFLNSLGARLFYSSGSYWIQYLPEIGSSPQQIVTVTPDNPNGVIGFNVDISSTMSNAANAGAIYLNRTAQVQVNKALKQQTVNYDFKPINRVVNFDWRTDTQSPFDGWEGDATGFFQRVGTGAADDLFRLRIPDFDDSGARSIWYRVPVKVGQRVEATFRSKSFLTLPAPDAVDYEVYTKALILLVEAGTLGGLQQRYLSTGGQWLVPSGGGAGEAEYYHIASRPDADNEGEVHILSESIPALPGITDYEILVIILDSEISPEPPPGSTYYTELYPVFAGVYNNPYVSATTRVVNNSRYSYVADDRKLFYMDTLDEGYSNTFFYKLDSGEYLAVPGDNWDGKTLERTTTTMFADQQARPYPNIIGDFLSNTLELHHSVVLVDMDNKETMILRDTYDVRKSIHKIAVSEIFPEGAATVSYTKTLKTQQTN